MKRLDHLGLNPNNGNYFTLSHHCDLTNSDFHKASNTLCVIGCSSSKLTRAGSWSLPCKYCPGQVLSVLQQFVHIYSIVLSHGDDSVIVIVIDIIMQLFLFFWWCIHEQNSADFHVEGSNVSKVYCFVINGIIVSKNCVEGSRNVCKGDGHLINVSWHWICLLVPSHLP